MAAPLRAHHHVQTYHAHPDTESSDPRPTHALLWDRKAEGGFPGVFKSRANHPLLRNEASETWLTFEQ